MKCFAILHSREVIDQSLTGRTDINILVRQIDKIRLAKAALRLGVRRCELGNINGDACRFASDDFLAIIVSPIGNGFEFIDTKRFLDLFGNVGQLAPIRPHIGDFVGDDQIMLGIHGALNIIAHNAGVPAACGHGAGIGIG